jgi:hypothetical protein
MGCPCVFLTKKSCSPSRARKPLLIQPFFNE